ncbi:zinc finger CCCH domain-containing protein 62 isoform X2 [Daucus carota subsp. sativus]|uniref:zinc finger CCCH domain-containing protein 62 isoform X2 n=1 Tax=Daucus carota subsp. sativus TaxID=79200 RepID=UPI0007F00D67|nr:PREDICTED: zinc finger CCCH domain-containing protein 62-like isoform X2 [Daucus carota subsp. sativus]
MEIPEQIDYLESETDSYDSEDDPAFDILEESRSKLSKLSIKSKTQSSIEIDDETEDSTGNVATENDQQGYDIVQKCIQAGQVDKLKVDQCKLYLRKHGLRLTGKKDVLIQRIKEHLDIVNGGGEVKYPPSSFILNCKGDACMGDVVMFEQTVYEMFSIASRSSVGPPVGIRTVAGRIVKESYGAAKQQHTFTVEVLWSKGVRPHPPLHPLLIKGRNLYKLKTMRQRWQDEGERQKILLEKHSRGTIARSNRDTRMQENEAKKMLKTNRSMKSENQNKKIREAKTSDTSVSLANNSMAWHQLNNQQNLHPMYQVPLVNVAVTRVQPLMQKSSQPEHVEQKKCLYSAPSEASYGGGTSLFRNANVAPERFCDRQVLANINQNSYGYQHNMIHNQGHGQFLLQRTSATATSTGNPYQKPMNGGRQLCRHYARGRCYYGEKCKFLHEC